MFPSCQELYLFHDGSADKGQNDHFRRPMRGRADERAEKSFGTAVDRAWVTGNAGSAVRSTMGPVHMQTRVDGQARAIIAQNTTDSAICPAMSIAKREATTLAIPPPPIPTSVPRM